MELDLSTDLRFLNEWHHDNKGLSLDDYLAMRRQHVFEDAIEAGKILMELNRRKQKLPTRTRIKRQVRLKNDHKRMAAGEIPFVGHLRLLSELYWKHKRTANHVSYTPRMAN